MTGIVEMAYWLALAAVVYPYLGYPILLWSVCRFRGASAEMTGSGEYAPSVTLIVSAYNEEAVIDRKLDNARSLDYPEGKLQIVVVSDASSDDTDSIVQRHTEVDSRVVLHRQEVRKGKTAGLNEGIAQTTGEVLVFSDANAIYEMNAIRELIRPLEDPKVGYVVGAALYSDSDAGDAQRTESLYWRYELAVKTLESRFGSVVGGDGAIYAIRRELYRPLKEDDINDFVNPLQIIAEGYRGVFNPAARCHEDGADSFAKEFRRKRRIVNRSWRATLRYGRDLVRRRRWAFVFQLASHKIARWFALPILLVFAIANAILVATSPSPFTVLSLAALLASAGLAAWGHLRSGDDGGQPRIVHLFYYFYLVNLAAMLGIYDETRGVRHTKWDHVRGTGS